MTIPAIYIFFLEFEGLMPRPFNYSQKTKRFTAKFASRHPVPTGRDNNPTHRYQKKPT